MNKVSYSICEYGLIRSKADYPDAIEVPLKEIYLPSTHFNSIYNYVACNQDESTDGEKPFSLGAKGKRKQIKVKNYVGVIETTEGLHLEILPKIHLHKTDNEEIDTKRIFLRMLKHLKNSPFINISTAHIEASKDFPILEVFIRSYIDEVEKQFQLGIKHDYIEREDNIPFLKGKLLVTQNIRRNSTDKSRFYCQFSEYSPNIPMNKIVKLTLERLLFASKNYKNIYSINKLLAHLKDVNCSRDISGDINKINLGNRLNARYQTVVEWSEVFLLRKSFTNFKGDKLNMAILFPMEKVFEDYMAYLFKKYSEGYKIKAQDRSYFLVEHKSEKRFGLKPDLLLNKDTMRPKIIDTKWKLLDGTSDRRNYNISQSDMYQLYAYGKKYTIAGSEPRLVLLYPSNPNFTQKLERFIYEGDLVLEIVPFDLSKDEYNQIKTILTL